MEKWGLWGISQFLSRLSCFVVGLNWRHFEGLVGFWADCCSIRLHQLDGIFCNQTVRRQLRCWMMRFWLLGTMTTLPLTPQLPSALLQMHLLDFKIDPSCIILWGDTIAMYVWVSVTKVFTKLQCCYLQNLCFCCLALFLLEMEDISFSIGVWFHQIKYFFTLYIIQRNNLRVRMICLRT